jgi:hypothetical protein
MVFLCLQVGVLSREEGSKGNHAFLRAPGFGAFIFGRKEVREMNRFMRKEQVSKLPGGGFIIETGFVNLILLNRKKIQVCYPKDLPLPRLKKFIERSFEDLERR